MLLTEFFSRHGKLSQEEFLEAFAGAFLLGRRDQAAPYLLHITRNTEVKVVIGSDEDVDFDIDDPTLDAEHAVVVFHEGFKGWTLEDKASSFGTHVDGDRVVLVDLRRQEVQVENLLPAVRVPEPGVVLDDVIAETDHEVGRLDPGQHRERKPRTDAGDPD